MDVDQEIHDDSELSSEEETLLSEIQALKAFGKEPAPSPVVAPSRNDSMDTIRLISSGYADLAATPTNLLGLNHLLIFNLKQMERQVESKLKENLNEQQRLRSQMSVCLINLKPEKYASFQKCGMPYFSTPCGWIQKKNEDTLLQERLGYSSPMLHFAPIYPWTTADNTKMVNLVVQFDIERKLEKLEEKMARLKKKGGNVSELSALRDECIALKSNKNTQLDEENIDWMRVAASLGLDFSATDCEYQWRSILSPKVNQQEWLREETTELHRIVKLHNYQSWDKIAAELGTNRSPLACCYQFQRTFSKKSSSWTFQETMKLKETMQLVGPSSRLKSHTAMLFMDKSYGDISRQVEKIQRKSDHRKKFQNFILDDSFVGKNLVKFKVAYKREMRYNGLRCESDLALVKAVTTHGANWQKIIEDVPSLGEPTAARERFQKLACFLAEAMGLGRIQMNQTHYNCASRLLQALEMVQGERLNRCGVNFKKDTAIKNLMDVMKPVKLYIFGPRYRAVSSEEEKLTKLRNLSAFSSLLSVNFDPTEIQKRWEMYSQVTDAYSSDHLDITKIMTATNGCTAPDYSEMRGRLLMPPNLITLLGARTLLLSRGLLHQQSTLPLTQTNGTAMNPDVKDEDRILFTEAKNRLRERMRTLFYTSLVMAKISVTNASPVTAVPTPRKPRPRPITQRKKRKLMAVKSKTRWAQQKEENAHEGDPL